VCVNLTLANPSWLWSSGQVLALLHPNTAFCDVDATLVRLGMAALLPSGN